MAVRGATLGVPVRSRRLSGRTYAFVVAALAVALAASLYAVLSTTGSGHRTAAPRAFKSGGLLSLPLAARAPISDAIGRSERRYRVGTKGSRLTAFSAEQHLASSFNSAGVSVASGSTSLDMRLTGVGYGTALRPVAAVVPRASDNRVTYSHPGLQEWYANGPLGLEQGFTLPRAPANAGHGPLTVALSLAGSAAATLSSDRRTVDFGSSRTGLRYTGLAAEDATGRSLPAWLSLSGGTLLLHVRTAGARYPVRIDPFVQGSKLTGNGGTSNNDFGLSVALSADGKTALVGAPDDEDGARNNGEAGAAFVFVLSGSKWEQQGSKLTGTGEEPIYFGQSVALSANGEIALVGAYETAVGGKQIEGYDQGAVYVFRRSGVKWEQQEVLLSGEKESYVEFGWSVALSEEGTTAVVGGPENGNGTPHAGHVWFFKYNGSTWEKQGKTLTGAMYEELGSAVALSGEGANTALIGAQGETEESDGGVGAAYVYTRSGGEWSEQAKFAGQGEGAKFGWSVALSKNGNTALIGAPERANREGAAYVYTRSGTEWKEQQKLPGQPPILFGERLALSGEGTTALVTSGTDVYAYTLSGGKWTESETLPGSGEGHYEGGVALSENGQTALVGAAVEQGAYPFSYEVAGPPPEAVTSAASEVTSTKAQLNGKVNPRGKEVTECKFEYGTTPSYGTSVPCGSPPGKGEAPVAVAASIGSLTANTIYHFRLVAKTSAGTSRGEDQTFTTLKTSATGETSEQGKPAKAEDEGLKVEASEGTGKVTIGPYGSNIGGPPLAHSEGKYVQVYHSEGSSFKKIEYEDCDLGSAKTIWWENPATGWEPIQEPVAVYEEATKCIKVTATESTTPSIAELSDPRHVGGPSATEQFGKCEPAKKGHFEDSLCTKEDYKQKGEVRTYKGKYEWLPEPVGCFAIKHGHYEDGGCTKEDFSENKKTHEKKYKGKYEKGTNSFKVAGGPMVIASPSQSSLQCSGSSSSSAVMRAANQSSVTLTLTGCERDGVKCASSGEMPGTIVTQPLESYSYEENSEYFATLAAQTMMSFSCATTEFRLSGTAAGQLKATLNSQITSTEGIFSESVGAQELELEETKTQTRHPATLTTKTTTTTEQPLELKGKT